MGLFPLQPRSLGRVRAFTKIKYLLRCNPPDRQCLPWGKHVNLRKKKPPIPKSLLSKRRVDPLRRERENCF